MPLVCSGATVHPALSTVTTSKHRSALHGQWYDGNKSLTTVRSPKDRIICQRGIGTVNQVVVFPSLNTAADSSGAHATVTLPTPEWGSDHCLDDVVGDGEEKRVEAVSGARAIPQQW